MITSHRFEDAPSPATTYFDAPTLGMRAAPPADRSLRLGFLDLPEDLDIVFGVVITLLGVGSALAALIIQW